MNNVFQSLVLIALAFLSSPALMKAAPASADSFLSLSNDPSDQEGKSSTETAESVRTITVCLEKPERVLKTGIRTRA